MEVTAEAAPMRAAKAKDFMCEKFKLIIISLELITVKRMYVGGGGGGIHAY